MTHPLPVIARLASSCSEVASRSNLLLLPHFSEGDYEVRQLLLTQGVTLSQHPKWEPYHPLALAGVEELQRTSVQGFSQCRIPNDECLKPRGPYEQRVTIHDLR